MAKTAFPSLDSQHRNSSLRTALDTPWSVALIATLPSLAGVWLGYGTDIDIANVLRAGQSALDGEYMYSRPPGAFPHEVATRVIDLAAGSVGVALASALFGFVTLWSLAWLVKSEQRPPAPTVLLVAANPWWWVATTSLGDFVWALAGITSGAVLAKQGRRASAGIAFGLAIGIRLSSVLFVVGWLLVEQAESRRAPVARKPGVTLVVAGVVAVLCFTPSWWAADRTLDFLTNEFGVTSAGVLVGRWVVKNLAFFGVAVMIALLAGTREWLTCVREWRVSVAVRFGLVGFVATELLFLRFPWKPIHLLPALISLALFASVAKGWRWHAILIAGSVLHSVAAVTVAAPDVPHEATSGRVSVSLAPGVLVNEIECRLEDRERGEWPSPETSEAADRAFTVFDCQASAWRTSGDDSVGR